MDYYKDAAMSAAMEYMQTGEAYVKEVYSKMRILADIHIKAPLI